MTDASRGAPKGIQIWALLGIIADGDGEGNSGLNI